jgi:enoyl-CoA hydratase/carnithine racemase
VLVSGGPLVLRLDGAPAAEMIDEAAANLVQVPTVSILIGDPAVVPPHLAHHADVCLSTTAAAPRPWVDTSPEPVIAAVEDQPLVALALVALLRSTEGQAVWNATAAEAATYGMLLGSGPFQRWLERRGPARPKDTGRPSVVVERHDAVLEVALDRPEARNAVDRAMRDALIDALAVAAADPTIEHVRLSGRGPSFCAGGDLAEFGTVDDGATSFAVRLTRHPGMAVHAVAPRTTAYLHGACVGAGIEISAFAARLVADPGSTFRLPEVGMGLVPGAGGTVSIPRRIGRHRTAWLALTDADLDASTALSWGLVDEVRPRAEWSTA